jgi:hypothetical protein
MVAHINDMELYWGFNDFWSQTQRFSLHGHRLEADYYDYPGRDVEKVSGHLMPEVEYSQIFLKNLGKEFSYHDQRKFLNERYIVIQDHAITHDYWNWHLSFEMEDNATMMTLCDGLDTTDTAPVRDEGGKCWSGFNKSFDYFLQTCERKGKLLDCSVNTRPEHASELGVYDGTDDFYTRGEWTYADPAMEAVYQSGEVQPCDF